MTDENPIATARRITRREEESRCLICGRNDCVEQHHVVGRNHDAELEAPTCLGCHGAVHEKLRRADVNLRGTSNKKERLKTAHKALAAFLRTVADALERWNEWV